MKYDIAHEVRLAYSAPVWEHHFEVRLTPLRNAHQEIRTAALRIEPTCEPRIRRDRFGNEVHAGDLIAPHDHLTVRSLAEVVTSLDNPFDYPVVPPAKEREWFDARLREQPRLWDCVLHRSALTPALDTLTLPGGSAPMRPADQPLLDGVMAALDWIGEAVAPARGFALSIPSKLEDVLAAGAGTSQDAAHLLISAVRGWGVPARYVMGYQDPGYTDDDAGQSLHAWAEILVPGAGWRGFDPTTRLVVNETYVAVALGRDAADAPPLKAVWKSGDTEAAAKQADVVVEVTRDQQ